MIGASRNGIRSASLLALLIAIFYSGCGPRGGASVSAGTTGSGTRDAATNVSMPTVTSPGANPYLSNGNTIELRGGCTTGYIVNLVEVLEGASAAPVTTTCAASAYAFTLSQSVDGLHSYKLYQQAVFQGEALANYSAEASFGWFRDGTPPDAPTMTSPASNPYTSGGSSITVAGGCETDATVYLGGASEQQVVCVASAYSFTVEKNVDGQFDFTLLQVDPAGNGASAPNFSWIRESKPRTPIITSPASSPVFSNGSTITLTGTCTAGYTVSLAGAVAGEVVTPAGSLTQVCPASTAFSYVVSKAGDGAHALTVTQTNPTTTITSDPASVVWQRDATPPAAPTIAGFGSNPYYSSESDIAIGGTCETDATVVLSGGSSQTQTCVGGAYSFAVNKTVDASYTFSVKQIDPASNSSSSVSQQWVRDTVAPDAPTRTSPGSDPFTSGDSAITISGACENNATVTLVDVDAATTDSQTCASSTYSFPVAKGSDGSYGFRIRQADRASNLSGETLFTWVRNTTLLGTPTITSPAADPYYTSTATLTLSGVCESGATVTLSGDVTDAEVTTPASGMSVACTAGLTYTFVIAKATDGSYALSVVQELAARNSSAATRQWVIDRQAPSAPTITAPASSPYYSNADLLTISGGCEVGATVTLAGASSQTQTCPGGGTYSFNVSKTSDGTYNFNVSQADAVGNVSLAATRQWVRDATVPAAPTITAPAGNPYVSSGDLTISGGCETGTTVTLGGNVLAGDVLVPAGALTRTCSASAYSFTIAKGADGTYNLTLAQRDRAGNDSASTSLQWIKESTIPATPAITAPAISPYYSNGNSLLVSGACVPGYIVYLAGDDTQSMTCAGDSTFGFTVAKAADATYRFFVSQENATTGSVSSEASVQWVRDTALPMTPTRLNPVTDPYTSSDNLLIQGQCEPGATVNLAGAAALSASCSSDGAYTLLVSTLVDGVHAFTVTETDLAGNVSGALALSWTRNSTLPATPTISSPNVTPYEYNGDSIVLAGDCTTGNTVILGGTVVAGNILSPAGSLTQSCSGSVYSFTIQKTVDGVYDFTVKQNDPVSGFDSGAAGQRWIRDVAPPVITLASNPANPNLSLDSVFTFSASETVTFECRLDGAAFASCASPKSYFELANGNHTFEVRGTDTAGNLGNTVSYSWTQAANRTVALYHLDSVGPTLDSGLFTGGNNNACTVNTGTSAAAAVFSEGRSFSSSGILSAPDSPTFGTISSRLTAEAQIKITQIPGSGFDVILGQHASTASNAGWELRLRKGQGNGKVRFGFYVSTGPSTGTEIRSSSVVNSSTTFYHLAATYERGAVKIFLDGKLIGSGTVSATALNNSGTLFRIGQADGGTNGVTAVIDEVRISQLNRYPAPFAVPSSAFTAD
ncbi:MAG: Ig-like domain-containing protein [Oligoflexia bacterium]|nr:Ig-like domain-containing protein [Oligoflexia bacterium]